MVLLVFGGGGVNKNKHSLQLQSRQEKNTWSEDSWSTFLGGEGNWAQQQIEQFDLLCGPGPLHWYKKIIRPCKAIYRGPRTPLTLFVIYNMCLFLLVIFSRTIHMVNHFFSPPVVEYFHFSNPHKKQIIKSKSSKHQYHGPPVGYIDLSLHPDIQGDEQ